MVVEVEEKCVSYNNISKEYMYTTKFIQIIFFSLI